MFGNCLGHRLIDDDRCIIKTKWRFDVEQSAMFSTVNVFCRMNEMLQGYSIAIYASFDAPIIDEKARLLYSFNAQIKGSLL